MNTEEERNELNRKMGSFVHTVMNRVKDDTGFRAVMSRADNPNQESMAWEHLISYCDIANESERKAFALIGASIARNRPDSDGADSFGVTLRNIAHTPDDKDREKERLRRLLACETRVELIQAIRPILNYVASKGGRIGYFKLLCDMVYWSEKTRVNWAKQFFQTKNSGENGAIEE